LVVAVVPASTKPGGVEMTTYLNFLMALLFATLQLFSKARAQTTGTIEEVYMIDGGADLVGQLETPNTPSMVEFLLFENADDVSLILVDGFTSEFQIVVGIETLNSLSSGMNLSITINGNYIGMVLPPDAPRFPLAGSDTPQHPDSTHIFPLTEDGKIHLCN
jgi:hypothetical protein